MLFFVKNLVKNLLNFIKENKMFFALLIIVTALGIAFGFENVKQLKSDIDLEDITGFDLLNGYSLLCHYGNRDKERTENSTKHLLELSKQKPIYAIPEEDTIYVEDDKIEFPALVHCIPLTLIVIRLFDVFGIILLIMR